MKAVLSGPLLHYSFGESVGSTAACPEGQTLILIVGSSRSALDCVTSLRKLTKPGLDPWRIVETVRATTPLSGGTLRTAETQMFTFTRSGTSTAARSGPEAAVKSVDAVADRRPDACGRADHGIGLGDGQVLGALRPRLVDEPP